MDEISHTELIQGMRMGYFPAGSVIIDAIEALQREKAEQAKRIAELEAQPAQSVPDGWKLVPDYKVGMPVKYNGKEAKIFAIGDRKGTFDLRLQSGCGVLNVPPDALEIVAVQSLDAQKPAAYDPTEQREALDQAIGEYLTAELAKVSQDVDWNDSRVLAPIVNGISKLVTAAISAAQKPVATDAAQDVWNQRAALLKALESIAAHDCGCQGFHRCMTGEAAEIELRERMEIAAAAIRTLKIATPSDGWQPIETAPKDEWILLFNGHWRGVGKQIDDEFTPWLDECDHVINPTPTHWQPLPAAPQEGV